MVTHTLIEHWNGTRWTVQPTPVIATDSLFAGVGDVIACSSPRACAAVGYMSKGPDTNLNLAERWNGRSWSRQRVPNLNSSSRLAAVACPAQDVCVAGGSAGIRGFAAVWRAGRWTVSHLPGVLREMDPSAVFCTSRSRCGLVGDAETRLIVGSWDGIHWSSDTMPQPQSWGASGGFNSVSCPSESWCAAVGLQGLASGNGLLAGVLS